MAPDVHPDGPLTAKQASLMQRKKEPFRAVKSPSASHWQQRSLIARKGALKKPLPMKG